MTKVGALLWATKALLLDFDGPVCSVFAGYPPPIVAEQLRQTLLSLGVDGKSLDGVEDPLALLRWVADNRPELARAADDVLRSAEQKAVGTATPTSGIGDVIAAARRTGRSIAIVSNNSDVAIRDYLDSQKIDVATVIGRPYAAPGRMKPNPDLVFCAINALGVEPGQCAFVGDTVTDVEAAKRAGVHSVAYAKSPDRIPLLVEAGAEVVVESMRMIAEGLEGK